MSMTKLKKTIAALRHPKTGCPWDLKQNHQSLLPFLIEESYEYVAAVEQLDYKNMEEELGDLLLQVVLHAQIAEENGNFDFDSIAQKINEKMLRRHPHVFDPNFTVQSEEEMKSNWEKIKDLEGKIDQSLLPHSTLHYPALKSAEIIGEKTNAIGFDWENTSQVMYKVEEEWQELKEELGPMPTRKNTNLDRIQEEMGDFLFSIAQLARHMGMDPEEVLRQGNKKFLKRFHKMEKLSKEDGLDFKERSRPEKEQLWNQAKGEE